MSLNKKLIEFYERRPIWREKPHLFLEEVLGVDIPIHQKVIIDAVRDYDKVSIRSANSVGKCQLSEELITLSDGTQTMAKNVVGKRFNILSFDEKTGQQFSKPAFAEDNGIKPCYKITTESGNTVIRTDNHLLYTSELVKSFNKKDPITGKRLTRTPENIAWRRCDELNINNLILVPEKININPTKLDFLDDEAKILGYLLGDGGTTTNVSFTQEFNRCREEFIELIESFGCTYRVEKSNNYTIVVTSKNTGKSGNIKGQNIVLNKIKDWGIFGKKAIYKKIPDFCFQLPNNQIALILNRLYSCDGYVECNNFTKKVNNKEFKQTRYKVSITLASEKLIDQIKHLLLRFGISSWKSYKKSTFKDKTFDSWRLEVSKREDIEKFYNQIGIFGKSEKLEEAYLYSKNFVSKDKEVKYKKINTLPGYRWEKITKVEYIGEFPTVAISVEDTHTYLTNICEHNSYSVSALIIQFFFCYLDPDPNRNVIVIFTAPSFDQVKDNIFSQICQFIETANDVLEKKFGEGVKFVGKISNNQNLAQITIENRKKDYIKGVTSNKKDNQLSGKHGTYVLIIYDEAQGVTESAYSDFKGITKSGMIVKQVMIGNTTLPNGKSGQFYESFGSNSTYHQIKISAFDTHAFIELDLKLADYYKSSDHPEYWKNKIDKYVLKNYKKIDLSKFSVLNINTLEQLEKSINSVFPNSKIKNQKQEVLYKQLSKIILPFCTHIVNPFEVYDELYSCGMNASSYEFKTRVLAEFPDENDASLFPYDWYMQSFENWKNNDLHIIGEIIMGVDVAAGLGADKSCISIFNGNKEIFREQYDLSTNPLVDKIEEVYNTYGPSEIRIECDALGGPIANLCIDRGLPVVKIQVGGSPGYTDPFTEEQIKETEEAKQKFYCKRDELMWNLREKLDPRDSAKPQLLLKYSDDLKNFLSAIVYKKNDKGKIQVIPNEELKKVFKKSGDEIAAINMATAKVNSEALFLNQLFAFITGN